jgi:hypothetical protein
MPSAFLFSYFAMSYGLSIQPFPRYAESYLLVLFYGSIGPNRPAAALNL